VVEQTGRIRIIKDGQLLAKPFADLSNLVTAGGEQGLLGLVFHPDFAKNGRLFVYYTARSQHQQVWELHAAPTGDTISGKRRLLLDMADPFANHNGGHLVFGPDGDLYIGTGDGGSGGDPGERAQNPKSPLGKLLRIDVDKHPSGRPYGIPPDNPFAGGPLCPRSGGVPCPEVFSYGLRNPFRFSFDRQTGDMAIGDVGQGTWEEVDYGPRSGATSTLNGANLGWSPCEGFFQQVSTTQPCGLRGHRDPVFAYPHSGTLEESGCAIIGGYVVRDPTLGPLVGRYLYGDLCRGDLRTLGLGVAGADPAQAGLSVGGSLVSFGQDSRGCVYAVADGTVYRVAKQADGHPYCSLPVS
jgi:glucose/arabinose dehydrogenase